MAASRKDSKGRVLKTGESERKDGLYQYRYTEASGERKTIYANNLNDLRKKEQEIQKLLDLGVSYFEGSMSVSDLLDRYLALKQHLRKNTVRGYQVTIKTLRKDKSFCNMKIRMVKRGDCQRCMITLSKMGYAYGTINRGYTILKSAFQMACDEDILSKNPCNFRLSSVIVKNTKKRCALTPEEQERFLKFIKEDDRYYRHYDTVVFMIETGLRIGELTGLTLNDIDWKNNRIIINHQLQVEAGRKKLYIETTKTEDGVRNIPLTPKARASLENIVKNRNPKNIPEVMIDGYIGFLFLTRNGTPRHVFNYDEVFRNCVIKYNKSHNVQLPNISPHILRHTFCTNCINAGMNIKSVQYLMGHATSAMTLDVYADCNQDKVSEDILLLGCASE